MSHPGVRVVIRVFGVELATLALEAQAQPDDAPAPPSPADGVDTGAADLTLADRDPVGFGLPEHAPRTPEGFR